MNYTETETSKMLKKCNDLIYDTTKKLFNTKSENVKNSLLRTLQFLNETANEYAKFRFNEIEEERLNSVELNCGLKITKGLFIDTQSQLELSDEETDTYITMCYLDSVKEGKPLDVNMPLKEIYT